MINAVIFDMFETLITHYNSPLYFGKQIAADMGIEESKFREIWDTTDDARTIGERTFEDVIEESLRKNNKYAEEVFLKVVQKRKQAKRECFQHLHQEIIPMMEELKRKNYKIGLITNCYYEEAEVIRESELFSRFDVTCLSCEEGVKKPDEAIFAKCVERLGVKAEECLYVGDGGNLELEAARAFGMQTLQAIWYLKARTGQLTGWKDGFAQAETPLAVCRYLELLEE